MAFLSLKDIYMWYCLSKNWSGYDPSLNNLQGPALTEY
jgi:hypothetical protein